MLDSMYVANGIQFFLFFPSTAFREATTLLTFDLSLAQFKAHIK